MDIEGLKLLPIIMLLVGVAAMIGGAMALTTNKVGQTMQQCYNSSYCYRADQNRCVGTDADLNCSISVNMTTSIGTDGLNFSNEYYVVYQGTKGIATGSEQISTISVVYVMVIIIGALMSVFAYFKFFG